ncbi:probable basic-leucine zipper transcription factor H [Lucilia cuprina]|uniref:probable basic-leucine zipper transcription factor H n=1 Tax=Lucilia cuprina TaxID=7375 RepID=UPI001F055808|nr:probable basic-leucine zipper transcription factor H [Lucilia cuprina]
MAEKGDLNPLKRPRVGITPEELQAMLEEKQKEIDFLNRKFDYIMKENEKLRILLKRMESESEEEDSSEGEMVIEEQEIPVENEIVRNKAEVSAESEVKGQNNAVSGSSSNAKPKAKKQEAGSPNDRVKVSSKEKSTQPKEAKKKTNSALKSINYQVTTSIIRLTSMHNNIGNKTATTAAAAASRSNKQHQQQQQQQQQQQNQQNKHA